MFRKNLVLLVSLEKKALRYEKFQSKSQTLYVKTRTTEETECKIKAKSDNETI